MSNNKKDNVQLSDVGFSYKVHTIDPNHTDPRYYKTYCGISFCCATITEEAPTCEECSKKQTIAGSQSGGA